MTMIASDHIYSIAAGLPFSKVLAQGLMDEAQDDLTVLARMSIFLPTRRAARALQDAFFSLMDGRALLLPRIHVIGSFQEDDLSLMMAGHGDMLLDIPPAIDPLERQALLAQLIQKVPGRTDTIGQAMELAGALAHLMDQVYTEGLDLANLVDLVPEDFAQHWQITLDFLKILSEHWPQILQDKGVIDAALRRDILIRRLTDFWTDNPVQDRIIAAGSTGSIPATAEFLACVAGLPNGQVVLPGFDLNADFSKWDTLPFSHPQGGFKKLLARMNALPSDVKNWPSVTHEYDQKKLRARHTLAREIMVQDHGTIAWRERNIQNLLVDDFQLGLDGVSLYETETQQDEAEVIALWLRSVLEEKDKKAILITPDRHLSRRVLNVCARWGVNLDDSAGQPLSKSPLSIYMTLVANLIQNIYDPVCLMAVLKNSLCMTGHTPADKAEIICQLEKFFLRNDRKPSWRALVEKSDVEDMTQQPGSQVAQSFFEEFIPFVRWVHRVSLSSQSLGFMGFLKVHCFVAYRLHLGDFSYDSFDLFEVEGHIYGVDDGRDVEKLIKQFSKLGGLFLDIAFSDYCDLFDIAINSGVLRARYGVHPRIQILGQMEARVIDADLVIMAGLNDGVWPADDSVDPWMSRPMQQQFGLPTSDQSLSLSAHDFVQGFCQSHVVMTRSTRIGGSPSVPCRWLQKLHVLADIAQVDLSQTYDQRVLSWKNYLDHRDNPSDFLQPAPCPDVSVRPSKLSVTKIETWLKDPYSIYALYILNVMKLPPLCDEKLAAIRGSIIHDVLDQFNRKYTQNIPSDALSILMTLSERSFEKLCEDHHLWPFWRSQFEKAFSVYLVQEEKWRRTYKPGFFEVKGLTKIQTGGCEFTLTARADRIDISLDDPDRAALIDYKTSSSFVKKKLAAGELPQLPLEGIILRDGGFDDMPALSPDYVGYWVVNSSQDAGTCIEVKGDLDPLCDTVETQLQRLVQAYNCDGAAYTSLPNPKNRLRYNDYEHLARISEWSNNDDADVNFDGGN